MTLVEREYELPTRSSPATIIDAGANIGLSTIHFAQRFPDAKIIAVEPDDQNFELLCRNVRPYRNVMTVKAALGPRSGVVKLRDPGVGPWGYRTVESRGSESAGQARTLAEVPMVTVLDLMQQTNTHHVDILKLDIEGAEADLMAASAAWIDDVDIICAELHDRFMRGCSLAFFQATHDFDFEWYRGENVFVARLRSTVLDTASLEHVL